MIVAKNLNISDDLTNKTGADEISVVEGVLYNYSNSDSVFQLMPLVQLMEAMYWNTTVCFI